MKKYINIKWILISGLFVFFLLPYISYLFLWPQSYWFKRWIIDPIPKSVKDLKIKHDSDLIIFEFEVNEKEMKDICLSMGVSVKKQNPWTISEDSVVTDGVIGDFSKEVKDLFALLKNSEVYTINQNRGFETQQLSYMANNKKAYIILWWH